MSLILYNTVYTAQEYVVPDWGSCTDAELATALEKHYAGEIDLHEHWKIEDGIVRPVTLTTGEQIELVLMHPTYPLADGGTAAFVVGMKDCLDGTSLMNDRGSNSGGWDKCTMRTWLNDTVYNWMSESFRQNLRLMNVLTAGGGGGSGTLEVESQDYLALPAEREVFGSNWYADSDIESLLFQFDWYKTASNRIKQQDGSAILWCERSPSTGTRDDFCAVDESGTTYTTPADIGGGVSFFCAI